MRGHATTRNYVGAGGLPPYRSSGGGLSWTNLFSGSNGLFAHTDHHALAFSSDGSRLYDGDDGGAYSTTTLNGAPGPWANLNATLAITEFSSNVSIHPSDPTIAFGGTQDNGTQSYTGNLAWDQTVGGDGGWTQIDFAVPAIFYGSFQGIQPYRLSSVASLANIASSFGLAGFILANAITAGRTPLRPLFHPTIVIY